MREHRLQVFVFEYILSSKCPNFDGRSLLLPSVMRLSSIFNRSNKFEIKPVNRIFYCKFQLLVYAHFDIIWFYMEFTPIKYQRIYKLDANNIVDEIKW